MQATNARADVASLGVLLGKVAVAAAPDATRVPIVGHAKGLSFTGYEPEAALTSNAHSLRVVRVRVDAWVSRVRVRRGTQVSIWFHKTTHSAPFSFLPHSPGQIVKGQLLLRVMSEAREPEMASAAADIRAN